MQIRTTKNPDGTFDVHIRRTRRSEKPVRDVRGISRAALAETTARMVEECRAGKPTGA